MIKSIRRPGEGMVHYVLSGSQSAYKAKSSFIYSDVADMSAIYR